MTRAANYGAEKTEFPKHMIVKGIFLPRMMVTNFQVWKCLPPMYGMVYHWLHRIDALDGVQDGPSRPYQPDVMGIGIRAQSESQCQGFNRGPNNGYPLLTWLFLHPSPIFSRQEVLM